MFIVISDSIIRAMGDSPGECASQLFKWDLDTATGKLVVNGEEQGISYTPYSEDKINGYKPHEMLIEAKKDLVKKAMQRGFTFFKEI